MRITFCGANREVTGSCYHIQTRGAQIVLDCGMFQGGKFAEDKNRLDFPFDPKQIDAVVVTHAHFDHTGRLPKLWKDGFRGKLWATKPTAELSMLTLRDSVHLMEEEAKRHEHEPLYGAQDVEPLEGAWAPIPYHQEVEILPGVRVYFTDAGHILGSASIRIEADGYSAVFSGDLGNTPVPLLHTPELQPQADVVIVESTYGNRVHEPANLRYQVLREAIADTVARKGVLLIPAFALERTQELLFELHHLHVSGQIPERLPIFLDSPMGINATGVFEHYREMFNAEAKAAIKADPELFHFKGLTYTKESVESKAILELAGPKVIIAGSGMMTGGRIMHHLRNYLDRKNTILMIVGYQVEGSLGRQLHDHISPVHIFGDEISVAADVRSFGSFSGHADYPRLMNWLHGFTEAAPKKIFVTHGELNSALAMSQSIEDQLAVPSGVPEYTDVVDLATDDWTAH